jgi:hypothetical protein
VVDPPLVPEVDPLVVLPALVPEVVAVAPVVPLVEVVGGRGLAHLPAT